VHNPGYDFNDCAAALWRDPFLRRLVPDPLARMTAISFELRRLNWLRTARLTVHLRSISVILSANGLCGSGAKRRRSTGQALLRGFFTLMLASGWLGGIAVVLIFSRGGAAGWALRG